MLPTGWEGRYRRGGCLGQVALLAVAFLALGALSGGPHFWHRLGLPGLYSRFIDSVAAGPSVQGGNLTVLLVNRSGDKSARLLVDGHPIGVFGLPEVTAKVRVGDTVSVQGSGDTFRVIKLAPGLDPTLLGRQVTAGQGTTVLGKVAAGKP